MPDNVGMTLVDSVAKSAVKYLMPQSSGNVAAGLSPSALRINTVAQLGVSPAFVSPKPLHLVSLADIQGWQLSLPVSSTAREQLCTIKAIEFQT